MYAGNKIHEQKEKKAIAKIEGFLDARREFWYPKSIMIYEKKSAYSSFNHSMKRETLCTSYLVKELLATLTIKVSSDWKKLDFLFSYKRENGGTSLPTQGILEVLKGRGLISGVRFYAEKDKEVKDQLALFSAHEREIAAEKAKRHGFGKVLMSNFFQGSFIYCGSECRAFGYVEGSELYWLSILKGEEADFLTDDGEIRDLMISQLKEWLHDMQPVQFDWSIQKEGDGENEGYLLKAFKVVSEIDVDTSFEEDAQAFSWRDKGSAAQCKSSALLPKDDVEDIIKKSGLKIPADAELVEIIPFREDTDTPCLKIRYHHVLADKDFNRLAAVSPLHMNPGKIIVERDFCTFYIDPERKRVFSEFRKWRPIKGT